MFPRLRRSLSHLVEKTTEVRSVCCYGLRPCRLPGVGVGVRVGLFGDVPRSCILEGLHFFPFLGWAGWAVWGPLEVGRSLLMPTLALGLGPRVGILPLADVSCHCYYAGCFFLGELFLRLCPKAIFNIVWIPAACAAGFFPVFMICFEHACFSSYFFSMLFLHAEVLRCSNIFETPALPPFFNI